MNDKDIKVTQEFLDAVHNGDEKKVYEIVKPGDYILLDNGHRYKFGGIWHSEEINRREHWPVNHCVVLPNGIIPWWDYKLYEHGTRGCLEMMFEANKQRIADRIKEK